MNCILFHSRSANEAGKILSNFYPSQFVYNERLFNSVEEAFQCMKFKFSSVPELYNQQFVCPKQAKAAGSKKGMKKLKCSLNLTAWNNNSLGIMNGIVRSRYVCDPVFKNVIDHSKTYGIQLYHFDRAGPKSFWGGYMTKDGNFMGNNALGKIMMGI